jgi:tryptophanyl-tRNA synthetase
VVIFSGIQPTGRKHLGNYIGAILNYVKGQDKADPAIYCIVDLHGTTVSYDPQELRQRTRETAALLVAAGLDPDRCILFRQGDVPEHTELSWLLSSVTSFGQLNRMHQFRDKAGAARERASAGLLYYPVLMAADVLAYRAHEVPVGEDQREHIELMRDVAEAFNKRFGETLVVPEGNIPTVGARVRDLKDPEKKMSTTGGTENGTIYVLDSADEIHRKFKIAVTDSGREVVHAEDKPGVSNLIEIMTVATGESISEVEARYDGQGYGTFKSDVAEAVIALLEPIQSRFREIRTDEAELRRLLALGAEKASDVAQPTLETMYERMGFVRLG